MTRKPFGTPVLTDEIAARLQSHESRALLDSDPDSPPLIPLTPELAADLKQLETLKKDTAALAAERALLNRRQLMESLISQCIPTKIGGNPRSHPQKPTLNIHPSSLDIEIEEDHTNTTSPTFIAWVPVIVYPIPRTPEKADRRFAPDGSPNFDLGQTSVVESFSAVRIATGKMNSAGQMIYREVGLKAFATLSMSNLTPDEAERRLSRRESKDSFESTGTPSDNDAETDGARTGMDSDNRAFIPSLTPTTRESRPTSIAAPFDTDGNSR